MEDIAPEGGAPPLLHDAALYGEPLGLADLGPLDEIVDELSQDPSVANLLEGVGERADELHPCLADLAELGREALLLLAAEPDAEAADVLVAEPVDPPFLDGNATHAELLELALHVPHLLDDRGGVFGRDLRRCGCAGESRRCAENEGWNDSERSSEQAGHRHGGVAWQGFTTWDASYPVACTPGPRWPRPTRAGRRGGACIFNRRVGSDKAVAPVAKTP